MPEAQEVTPAVDDGAAQLEAPQQSEGEEATNGDQPEQLNEGGVKALKAERDARRKLERELAQLRKAEQDRADAEKSELQRAQEAAQRLEAELTAAKRAAFAATKGVPEANLTGATPEEWEAAADALIAWRNAAQPAPQAAPHAAGVQGNTGQPVTTNGGQLTREDLSSMTPAQIDKALSDGRFAALLSGKQ